MPNAQALRDTLEHIKTHPEEWDQSNYRRCFAGITARLAGGVWSGDDFNTFLRAAPDDPPEHLLHTGQPWQQNEVLVRERAARLLGLTDWEAMGLFWGYNDLDDLQRQVDNLTGSAA